MPALVVSSVLPSASAVSVSADARLRYVLRHFALAYEEVAEGLIGYVGDQRPITIADTADAFFQHQRPYPAAPNYREWAGQMVPFFFDAQPPAPLLELTPGRVRINAVGFFFESPDVGAFLWALSRENDGSFVGMSRP